MGRHPGRPTSRYPNPKRGKVWYFTKSGKRSLPRTELKAPKVVSIKLPTVNPGDKAPTSLNVRAVASSSMSGCVTWKHASSSNTNESPTMTSPSVHILVTTSICFCNLLLTTLTLSSDVHNVEHSSLVQASGSIAGKERSLLSLRLLYSLKFSAGEQPVVYLLF